MLIPDLAAESKIGICGSVDVIRHKNFLIAQELIQYDSIVFGWHGHHIQILIGFVEGAIYADGKGLEHTDGVPIAGGFHDHAQLGS